MAESCYDFDLGPPAKKLRNQFDNGDYEEESNAAVQMDKNNLTSTADSSIEEITGQMQDEILGENEEDNHLEDGKDPPHDASIIVVHMDIREPLTKLRSLLQKKVNIDLTLYCFTLQQEEQLESSKTLVDQCVLGEGVVQINVKLREDTKPKTIDIVDVLKPDDDYTEDMQEEDVNETVASSRQEHRLRFERAIQEAKEGISLPSGWLQDIDFSYKLIRFNIPMNPMDWQPSHVRHWLLWAVREFNLVGINLKDWYNMPGYLLCAITHKEFRRRVPNDPEDIFWQHCQILKTYKTVAVRRKDRSKHLKFMEENSTASDQGETDTQIINDSSGDDDNELSQTSQRSLNSSASYLNMTYENESEPGCSRLNIDLNSPDLTDLETQQCDSKYAAGATCLWQFLLELLVDWRHRDSIQWVGTSGEFCMLRPEVIAKMWGYRKNKPTMNYDKLSRALRYYYDGDMISKVPGRKFIYKFICDLKFLLGYSVAELNQRVMKAEKKFATKRATEGEEKANEGQCSDGKEDVDQPS